MERFELNGLNLLMVQEGFVNSKNPERQKFIDFCAEASENPIKEEAIIRCVDSGWGVNGENIYNIIAYKYLTDEWLPTVMAERSNKQ